MATPVPNKPQQTRVVGGVANVIKENNTMMVKSGDGALWVQNGVIYDDAGKPLTEKQVPPWFWEEYKKLTPEIRASHGELHEPEDGAALVKPQAGFPSRDPPVIPNVEDDPLVDLGELNKPQVILTADEVRRLNEQTQVGQDRGTVVVRGTQGPDPTADDADREANGPKAFGKPVTINDRGDVEHATPDPAQPAVEDRDLVAEKATEKADLMSLTKAELIDLAETEEVPLGGGETKEVIADKIIAARV